MDSKSTESSGRRARRRNGSASKLDLRSTKSIVNAVATSRFMPVIMAIVAAGYIAQSVRVIDLTLDNFPPIWRGISKIDARYIAGPPQQEGKDRWVYAQNGTTQTVLFDNNDQARELSCITQTNSPLACSPLLTIGINTTEDKVWKALGPPDQQQYFGETKVITYDGIGVKFTLERFEVKGIALVPQNNPVLKTRQIARIMLP